MIRGKKCYAKAHFQNLGYVFNIKTAKELIDFLNTSKNEAVKKSP